MGDGQHLGAVLQLLHGTQGWLNSPQQLLAKKGAVSSTKTMNGGGKKVLLAVRGTQTSGWENELNLQQHRACDAAGLGVFSGLLWGSRRPKMR